MSSYQYSNVCWWHRNLLAWLRRSKCIKVDLWTRAAPVPLSVDDSCQPSHWLWDPGSQSLPPWPDGISLNASSTHAADVGCRHHLALLTLRWKALFPPGRQPPWLTGRSSAAGVVCKHRFPQLRTANKVQSSSSAARVRERRAHGSTEAGEALRRSGRTAPCRRVPWMPTYARGTEPSPFFCGVLAIEWLRVMSSF